MMLKLILGLVTLLSLTSAGYAAFAIFQTYQASSVTQISCNIVTGVASVGGPCASPPATCNGDVQRLTRTVTITNSGSGNRNVGVTANTFVSGDVGKRITIDGAGNGGGRYFGTIATFVDAQNIVLGSNVGTVLTSVSTGVNFGTSDNLAFDAFNNWARANQGSDQVVLTIPNGSNCWFGSGTFNYISVFNAFAAGINNLIVEGTGATINSVGGQTFQLGGLGSCFQGITATPGCVAQIQTVSSGSNTLTFTAASYAAGYVSRFTVGGEVMIGGLDPQALFSPTTGYGDPVNLWAFEWKTVTAICNNTGACPGQVVLTLDSPLADTYYDTWPLYNPGDQFHSTGGGPAMVWAMHSSWDATFEYRGLTISQEGQTYAQGRNLTYRNVIFTGDHGGIPTQNEAFSAIDTDYGFTNMETDKLVGTMLFDGVTIAKVVNQSTATKRFIVRNSTFTIGLDGGAQYTEISDTDVGNWAPGIWVYGSLRPSDITICIRCTIDSINYSFGPTSQSDYNYYTKSGSVIIMPNAGAQGSGPGQRYFVPGALVYYSTSNTNPPIAFSCCESIGSFQVTTISGDPWPALDNQTLTTTINITSSSKALNVPSGPFVSGDVGKTIAITGAGNGGGNLYTVITGYSSATDVTLYNAAATTVAGPQTIQWGTSNTYIDTNQASAFPITTAFNSAGSLYIKTTGTPNITCDECNVGDPTSTGYGISIQAGATPAKPLGSYIRKQYTPTSAQGALASINARGIFKGMSINVTSAATSAGAVTFSPVGQFQTFTLISQNVPGTPAPVTWTAANFSINLKQTGNREISASGVVTCNGSPGACSGDTINPPANMSTMWLPFGSFNPYMGSTHTSAPTFTMTIEADPIQ